MDSGGVALAQAAPGGADFSFLLMMGSIFLIFYFLVIRPQQKQQKERERVPSWTDEADRLSPRPHEPPEGGGAGLLHRLEQ